MLSLFSLALRCASGLNIAGMVRIFQGLDVPRITQFSVALFIALQVIFTPALAAPDDDFLAARDAYVARNSLRLDQYARKLQGHLLAPFAQYWQLSLNLDVVRPEEIKAFLDNNGDAFVSDRLRAEWLKLLGKQKQWAQFQTELPLLVNEDSEINCYQLQARLAVLPTDKTPLVDAKRLWFSSTDLATSCNGLFEQLTDESLLSVEEDRKSVV